METNERGRMGIARPHIPAAGSGLGRLSYEEVVRRLQKAEILTVRRKAGPVGRLEADDAKNV
jgi:hypothetical protein